MKQLRLIVAAFLLFVGGVLLEVVAADYKTVNGVKYRTEGNIFEGGMRAYIVDIDGYAEAAVTGSTEVSVTIPQRLSPTIMDYQVYGFDRNVKVPLHLYTFHLTFPENFMLNDADLSSLNVLDIMWSGALGYVGSSKFRLPQMKVFYTTYGYSTLSYANGWHAKKVKTVAPVTLLKGDCGEGYYYSSEFDDGAAVVSELIGSAENITIHTSKQDKEGVSHTVKYFGLPDVNITNTTATSLTFEGPIALYGSLSGLTNLKKVSFAEVEKLDNICSLNGKLTNNSQLEEIYFTGNTLPALAGAATDYVYDPSNVTVYISPDAGVTPAQLKTQDVWGAFKDIKIIGADDYYDISVEAHNAQAKLEGIQYVRDGESYSGHLKANTTLEIYANQTYGDYTLKHFYVDGQDLLSQMGQRSISNVNYRYYKFDDGKDHSVRLEGEAEHVMFDKLMVHQSGEGNTSIIAKKNNATTEQLNVPQGTSYGILDVASKDLQQVEVRFFPVNDGKPTVYNGTQQIAADNVNYNSTGNYYYTTKTLNQLQAGDFTVVYPVSYAQQEGIVKTTVSVRNYTDDVIYNFSTSGDTPHNATVANNTTEDIYHKYANDGTYTIKVHALSRSAFRIQENGVDVTDQAEQNYIYFTYTMQHPDQNGTIIVDNGCDMRLNMTTNAAGIASFRYTDVNNGTQTKNFGKGQEIYAVSSKNRTDQELIVTTDVGFTLYRNGVDISDQYASSNVNANDASKRDYHFYAYGDHNALNFVDGEDLNLVLLNAQSIPVMAQSNTKDSRGIKIETFRFDENVNVDPATLHTWGNIASAPVGGYEQLKVYFYHTNDERLGEFYINGKKYTGGYETEYRGNPESTADCFAMRFSGVGRTGYNPSEDYNSLNLEAIFISENGLDATKANAVVSMSDESKQAFAEMTYDIHRLYSSETSKTETMRKGLKTFVMEKDQLDDDSYMEYEVYAPEDYDTKIYVEGEDYTTRAIKSISRVNGIDYNTVKLRFDSQLMPQYRRQNTSWLVTVTKSITEARRWNVTLLGDKTRTNVSFYDELNANKAYHERENCGSSGDITANTIFVVPFNAETASFIVEFNNEYDLNTGDPLYNLNDYDLVVKADGQDVSYQFNYNGENAYVNYNLNPELLSATDWIVGFKEKASTVVTHTATLTGDIGSNQVAMQWEDAQGQMISSYTVSSATPNATSTMTENPAACRAIVNLQDGYTFKAFFNGEEAITFTKNADGTYTLSSEAPAHIDGSWVFEFTKKPAEIIEFADANVKAICVAKWDTDGDGELSKEEAAAVTTLTANYSKSFYQHAEITSFDEFQYFTGLTKINDHDFSGCKNLTSIILPNTIKEIGQWAFGNCKSLTRINLPESLEKIGDYAFDIMYPIETVYIPKNVSTIGNTILRQCNNLRSIVVAKDNETFDSRNGCNAIIRKSDNALIAGCMNTVIPDGVTSIGFEAFNYHTSLTEIVIPASVSSIGDRAFCYCTHLSKVVCKRETPATLGIVPFANVSQAYNKCKLYVPMGTKQAYIDAGWTTDIFTGGIFEESEYDLNNDNKVTITDAVRMLDIILHGQ